MQHAIDIFFWSCMMQDWHLPCAFLLVSYVLCTLDTCGSSHLYASEECTVQSDWNFTTWMFDA